MKITSLIINFDFLGFKQGFSIGSRRSFQTYLGACCSFIVTIIITYFAYSFSKKVLERKNPNIIVTTYIDEHSSQVNFDQHSFILTLALQNPDYSYYLNESIYKLTTFAISKEIIDSDGTIQTTEEEIPLIKCSDISEFELIPDYFMTLDLDNLYCLHANNPIILEGEYGKNIWKFIQFRFSKCINSTLNNYSCSTKEEIETRLSGGYLGLFMSHYTVVPNNYKEPIKLIGKNIFGSFSGKYYSDFFMYLKTLQVNTDKGLFTESLITEKKVCYSSHNSANDQREVSDNFLSLTIQMTQEREVYDRSYKKIQGVAAEIGGIMKVCLFSGEIIVYFFRRILYQDYITSFFYETKENKKFRSLISNNNNNIQHLLGKTHRETNQNTILIPVPSHFNINSKPERNSDMNYSNYVNLDKDSIANDINALNRLSNIKRARPGSSLINNYIKKTKTHVHSTTSNIFRQNTYSNFKPRINQSNSIVFDTLKPHQQTSISKHVNIENSLQISSYPTKLVEVTKPQKEMHLWMMFGPCLFNKSIKTYMQEVNRKYNQINFLFDVLHYLKIQNDCKLLKKLSIKGGNYLYNYFKTYNFILPTQEEVNLFKESLITHKRMQDFKRKVTDSQSFFKTVINTTNNHNNFPEIRLQNSNSNLYSFEKG